MKAIDFHSSIIYTANCVKRLKSHILYVNFLCLALQISKCMSTMILNHDSLENIWLREEMSPWTRSPCGARWFDASAASKILRYCFLFFNGFRAPIFAQRGCRNSSTRLALQDQHANLRNIFLSSRQGRHFFVSCSRGDRYVSTCHGLTKPT